LKYYRLFIFLLFISCNTGKLTVIADVTTQLDEASAIETITNSNLLWTIEDAGNKNHLYGLNTKGQIIKDVIINNATNVDWEDLTSDTLENIYIGDFGDNHKKRINYTIYKVSHPEKTETITAETINFTLPKEIKPKNFEAFFIYNDNFYIFSKEDKKSIMIKVPNSIGNHIAEVVSKFNLEGKHNKITSADISDDGKTVILLNHDKIWVLSNYKNDGFLDGKITMIKLNHDSQKEGVCFKSKTSIYITDERSKLEGGNLYEFNFD